MNRDAGTPGTGTLTRRIELTATLIMATAAILTAWAAYQNARWGGIQSMEYSRASAARIESTRFDSRSDALRVVDVITFVSWLDAVADEISSGASPFVDGGVYQPPSSSRSAFYHARMRQEFRPALDAWIATDPLGNTDAPQSPFVMDSYVLADAVEAQNLLDQAHQHTDTALDAGRHADAHVLTAVMLALAIFFSGVSSKLDLDRNRLIMVALSGTVFLGAAVTLVVFLPTVSPF